MWNYAALSGKLRKDIVQNAVLLYARLMDN